MKTFVFSAVAMAVMASCTSSEIDDVVNNDEPVAIHLSAGVQTNVVASRAAIVSGTTFKATVLGWETQNEDSYTGEPTWITATEDITASLEGKDVTFTEKQYYQSNGGRTHMKAISPVLGDTPAGGVYSFNPAIVTDGSADVLVSNAIYGSKSAAAPVLAFEHALTQLTFTVKKDASISDADVDVVKSIELDGIQFPTGYNSEVDTFVLGGTQLLKVFEAKVEGENDGTIVIPGSESSAKGVGKPVMIAPITDFTKMSIKVTTNHGTFTVANLESSTSGKFNAGVAYTIELTFKRTEISSATASVKDWDNTGTGSGTVE